MTLPRYPLSPLDCIGFKEVSMSTPSGMVSRTRLFTESNIALIESLRWPSSSSSAEAATPGICGGASEASLWTKAQRLLTKSSPNRCERSASGRSITRQIGGNRAVATFLEAAVSYYENGGNALRQAAARLFQNDSAFAIGQAEVKMYVRRLYSGRATSTRQGRDRATPFRQFRRRHAECRLIAGISSENTSSL
jgi:hypothetical protein